MMNIAKFHRELLLQLKTSIPASLNAMGNSLPWLISIGFVGRIGAHELAAAALATSICNVTGLSLSMGLSSAVTTLTGQSKGKMMRRRQQLEQQYKEGKKISVAGLEQNKNQDGVNNSKYDSIDIEVNSQSKSGEDMEISHEYPMTPMTYFYRGIFIQLMFVVPVGSYWLYGIKSALISLGQEEKIAEMAQVCWLFLSFSSSILSIHYKDVFSY